jgi:hypothetical protein
MAQLTSNSIMPHVQITSALILFIMPFSFAHIVNDRLDRGLGSISTASLFNRGAASCVVHPWGDYVPFERSFLRVVRGPGWDTVSVSVERDSSHNDISEH